MNNQINNEDRKNILNILDKLIAFKSVTPKGEDAMNYVADFLLKMGFECDIKTFGEGDEATVNLYAQLGNDSPNICFAGHIDVVPTIDKSLWMSDPFKMTVEGDIVRGRGVVDMKGAVACAMNATAKFLKHSKPKGSISFLLTTDEEGDAVYGLQEMLKYIDAKNRKIDFCILGEPTCHEKFGDAVIIGRRGSVNFHLKVKGKAGHVAYQSKSVNPITSIIKTLKDLSSKELDSGTEFFEKSNLELTSVDVGNYVTNIIPETAEARFNIRFNDNHTAKSLYLLVDEIIKKHCSEYELKYWSSSSPFVQKYSDKMKDFVELVKDETGIDPKIATNGGTSDGRFIYKYGEVIEFGLCDEQAHKINEYGKISDLQKLHNVYYNCLNKFA